MLCHLPELLLLNLLFRISFSFCFQFIATLFRKPSLLHKVGESSHRYCMLLPCAVLPTHITSTKLLYHMWLSDNLLHSSSLGFLLSLVGEVLFVCFSGFASLPVLWVLSKNSSLMSPSWSIFLTCSPCYFIAFGLKIKFWISLSWFCIRWEVCLEFYSSMSMILVLPVQLIEMIMAQAILF